MPLFEPSRRSIRRCPCSGTDDVDRVIASIEARMTSSRLPGKMTMPIAGMPVLQVLIERLKCVDELDGIVLATTTNADDDVLAGIARRQGIEVHRGSEYDVLGRVRNAADQAGAGICVEITGDCPLVDPAIVSRLIREFWRTRRANAYVANTTGPRLGAPHGLDVQVFEADALRRIEDEVRDAEAREHVSLPFYREDGVSRWHPRFVEFFPDELCRRIWLSLDYREDYDLIRQVHEELVPRGIAYDAQAMIDAALARPEMTRACLDLRGW